MVPSLSTRGEYSLPAIRTILANMKTNAREPSHHQPEPLLPRMGPS
ncbi:hypothetical protein [Thermococcus sp.]|nr:hypothetical protein [Thermococcus sp.]